MAIVYEVTLKQNFFGQTAINRWNYLGTGTPIAVVPAFALLSAMGLIDTAGVLPLDTVGGDIQRLQTGNTEFIQALCRTVTNENPTDFYDYPYPAGVVGSGSGSDSMTPVNAYGFFTNRVRTDISRGTKRFVDVVEGAVGPGGVLESAAITALNGLAEHMTDVLSYTTGGESLQFAPIVCGKLEYTTPSGKRGYKYYSTQVLQQAHIAQGIVWQPYREVRSQVSRQYKP